jgi:mono/diheme cytochrome c family protein
VRLRPGPLLGLLLGLTPLGCGAATAGEIAEGEYLFHAAGCLGCHTREDGEPLAGGRALETPFGVFYSPNITPDAETGIGRWQREDFIRALRHGRAPDGSAYFPVFPYTSYRLVSDSDAARLYDYLMSRPAVAQRNRAHEPAWWLARWMMPAWQWWFLEEPPTGPADPGLQRGRYLVDALGHCGECHTPRTLGGGLDHDRYLAGNPDGPDGDAVPNITPDRDYGIGKWDADDLGYFLESGELPDGDYTGGKMTEVVDNTTSRLTAADRSAMVDYLRSIDPRGPE